MGTVMVVEDERALREGLVRAVETLGHTTIAAAGITDARSALAEQSCDCIVLDVRLKDGDGLAFLKELRTGDRSDVPVVMATAYGDSDRTIEAMRLGAFDYVTKPFDLPALLDVVDRAVRQHARVRSNRDVRADRDEAEAASSEADTDKSQLVGTSAAMLGVWKVLGRAAASDVPVLITGETGTGKELVARAIHAHSVRSDAPFVAVNLAALPPTLIESELFGHEKGAFTGAAARRLGRIEQAAGGTLFLDEIGDLDATLQTKLLRVLQERRFERVGGTDSLDMRARIVAATHRTVRPTEPGATLREDLYYRLAVIELHLPPLRDRRSDVPLLVGRALRATRAEAVTEEAMERLQRHAWPGNVRELFHVIHRAAAMSAGGVIDLHDLPESIRAPLGSPPASGAGPSSGSAPGAGVSGDWFEGMQLRDAVALVERKMIERALEKSGGNRAEAARILGIARPQLYTKMDEHGLGGRGRDG